MVVHQLLDGFHRQRWMNRHDVGRAEQVADRLHLVRLVGRCCGRSSRRPRSVPDLPDMMVWPSGFWRTKSLIAIVPPPPDLFSTTVVCAPRDSADAAPSSRAHQVGGAAGRGRHDDADLSRSAASPRRGPRGRARGQRPAASPAAAAAQNARRRDRVMVSIGRLPSRAALFVERASSRAGGRAQARRCAGSPAWLRG